jgi:NAD-dependent deacetylase
MLEVETMIVNWLKESKHTVILTGAGMSTESGLPDFRSSKGLWKQKSPEKLASVDALNHNVQQFIEFYKERVIKVNEYGPHQGHEILAKWEKKGIIKSIITQNVDGFHQMAGSKNVIELHGTLQKMHCQKCKRKYSNEVYVKEEYICECGGTIRPSVVLFGEMLPEDAVYEATMQSEMADLFIVLGSSLQVSPANQFPLLAKRNGAKFVIVNLEPTEFDHYADEVIHDVKIGEWLQQLDRKII